MSYKWDTQGPGFQFPTCYRIENRFLTLRAAALFLLAAAILWVALSDPEPAKAGAAYLRVKAERGDPAPHVWMAVLLLLLMGLDLWAAARQRRLALAPGQPASLGKELTHQSTGTTAGAGWLLQVLRTGEVPAADVRGGYLRLLRKVAPSLSTLPSGLLEHLRVRMAHLLFATGLLVGLGLTALVAAQESALALAALLYGLLAAALVVRSAWIAKAAPGPIALAVVLGVAVLSGLALARFGAQLPQVARLAGRGLPAAAAVTLLSMLLIEALSLLAGRAQRDVPVKSDVAGGDASADVVAEPERLMQELERALHGFWSDGVPNRRHARQPPAPAVNESGGKVSALVLEETQPALAANSGDAEPSYRSGHQAWLLVLDSLGLVLTIAGGVLWVQLAYQHIMDATASWAMAPTALVLVVAGGYALRAGHLLWSRIEVESQLLWVEFGSLQPGAAADAVVRAWHLRSVVVRARSVFYAAAEHAIGSRRLLHLVPEPAAAKRLIDQVQAYAERAVGVGGDPRSRAAAPAARATPASMPGAVRPPARYCPACGTAVLQGARFCQQCGNALQPG